MEIVTRYEDVLLQVLCRLPKKSQRRFQVVSKKWHNLIKEAESFSSSARSLDSGFVFVVCGWSGVEETKFYRLDSDGALTPEDSSSHVVLLHPPKHRIWMMGSCNGVVFYYSENYADGRKRSYHLYNPLTKQKITLPSLGILGSESSDDKEPYPTGIGLALDLNSNGYKFIVIYWQSYEPESLPCGLTVAIFHSERGEWETKPARFDDDSREFLKFLHGWGASSVYRNGILYWLQASYLIVFFSTGSEESTLRVLELPQINDRDEVEGVLWESEGRINYCQIDQFHGLCIWVLDHEAAPGRAAGTRLWRKIFNVSYETLNSMGRTVRNIAPFRNGITCFKRVSAFNEHLQIIHLQSIEGVNVCYNIPEKTLSTLQVHPGFHFPAEDNVLQLPFAYRIFNLNSH